MRNRSIVGIGLTFVTLLAGCSSAATTKGATTSTSSSPPPASTAGPSARLLAAGDIADCKSDNDSKTAALIAARPTVPVAQLGDLAYESGTTNEFAQCYGPAWGAFNDRSYPVPGNHEYNTKGATPYYAYFGARAAQPGEGWYSYDLGAWHIVALNSNCDAIGGCDASSPQAKWLSQDLAAHPARCTLAYWHHPRFSSGPHGSNNFMQPIWQILNDAHADVVLSGHDHDYERFAPMNATGTAGPQGVRQFVVGTGGRSLYPIVLRRAGSEVTDAATYGILDLTLRPTSYDWTFVPVEGQTFTDSGSATCTQ